jgi:ankyrin repeat protein
MKTSSPVPADPLPDHRLTAILYLFQFPVIVLIATLLCGCGNSQESARKELAKLGKDYNTAVFVNCIRDGDKLAVRLFIESGVDVNQPDRNGFTPLMIASWNGNADAAKLLLKNGANSNAAMADGRTALQFAKRAQRVEIVKMLMARGAKDFNQMNNDLATAVINDKPNEVQNLLSQGADPDIRFSDIKLADSDELAFSVFGSYTPLTEAANAGSEEVARILLEHGADPNRTDRDGDSALMYAARKGNTGIVKLLLQKKADVNLRSGGQTAVSIARQKGFTEIERLLDQQDLTASNPPRKEEPPKETQPLILAAKMGESAKVKLLLDQGAQVNETDQEGATALIQAAAEGKDDVVQLLLNAKADINLKDHYGSTATMHAASRGQTGCLKLLLAVKPDLTAVNDNGLTALTLAKSMDQKQAVALLKEAGAKEPR